MALTRAVSLAFQAASATPVVSSALGTAGTGGLLQSLVPAHGYVDWAAAATVSPETSTIVATAFLLVASGIKNFKL